MKHPFSLTTKLLVLTLVGLFTTERIHGQEAIPLEEAQKVAQKLAATPTAASDQPFTVDVNADKPVGLKGGDAGLIVLPDKRLTADLLAGAGKTIVPVAQLWTYKVTLATDGKPIDSGKVRMVTISEGDKSRDVQLFLVGVAKNEQGVTEMVIFGKGSEPVLRIPLTKGGGENQDSPIAISGRKSGEDSATLTLTLFGQYAADVLAMKTAD